MKKKSGSGFRAQKESGSQLAHAAAAAASVRPPSLTSLLVHLGSRLACSAFVCYAADWGHLACTFEPQCAMQVEGLRMPTGHMKQHAARLHSAGLLNRPIAVQSSSEMRHRVR